MLNKMRIPSSMKPKATSVTIENEEGRSYLVTRFEGKKGQVSETRVLVDKQYFQPLIDKAQETLNKYEGFQNECEDEGEEVEE